MLSRTRMVLAGGLAIVVAAGVFWWTHGADDPDLKVIEAYGGGWSRPAHDGPGVESELVREAVRAWADSTTPPHGRRVMLLWAGTTRSHGAANETVVLSDGAVVAVVRGDRVSVQRVGALNDAVAIDLGGSVLVSSEVLADRTLTARCVASDSGSAAQDVEVSVRDRVLVGLSQGCYLRTPLAPSFTGVDDAIDGILTLAPTVTVLVPGLGAGSDQIERLWKTLAGADAGPLDQALRAALRTLAEGDNKQVRPRGPELADVELLGPLNVPDDVDEKGTRVLAVSVTSARRTAVAAGLGGTRSRSTVLGVGWLAPGQHPLAAGWVESEAVGSPSYLVYAASAALGDLTLRVGPVNVDARGSIGVYRVPPPVRGDGELPFTLTGIDGEGMPSAALPSR